MREAETRAATPTGIVGDRRYEPVGKGYETETYRPCHPAAIPSPENPSRQARVVAYAGRLYAVAPFREVRA